MNTTTTEPVNLTVDFKHLLAARDDKVDARRLHDTIHLMADKAIGVLYLLSLQFEGGATQLSEEINQNAICSVISEVENIKAVVDALLRQ